MDSMAIERCFVLSHRISGADGMVVYGNTYEPFGSGKRRGFVEFRV